jgi:hypothetical protein
MKLKIFFFLFCVMAFLKCEKVDKIDFSHQKILFQIEYINYAWGFAHQGLIIDSIGNVYSYNLPKKWVLPDSSGFINTDSLTSNLLNCSLLTYKIDPKEISAKLLLMESASKGKLAKPVTEMADAGINSYYEFSYNTESKSYKRILLKQVGDIRIDNESPQAIELWKWLAEIDNQTRLN